MDIGGYNGFDRKVEKGAEEITVQVVNTLLDSQWTFRPHEKYNNSHIRTPFTSCLPEVNNQAGPEMRKTRISPYSHITISAPDVPHVWESLKQGVVDPLERALNRALKTVYMSEPYSGFGDPE